jgi:2'-5' RNA ligase
VAEKRLFFALWPDLRQQEQLRNTISPIARLVEGNAVNRGNWHVTLVFIGQFPEERVAELLSAVADIQAKPFRLRFDRLSFWQRPRIACMQAMSVPPPLEALVNDLNGVLKSFDCPLERGNYRPHITVVRNARSFESIVLARPLELQWSGFELIESVSSPRGVQYCPLKQ